jgi:uncharacterized membrane protein
MRVEKKIEVGVPVRTAYNQWTQFEEFPKFMDGVKEVQQLSDERLHWVANVGGKQKDWTARITRQVPDQVVAWVAEGGATLDGTVIFHPIDEQKTEVQVHMEFSPEDFQEQVGGALGFIDRKVEADLNRFKDYIESRGSETGAWRGEIQHGENKGETAA